MSNQRAFEDACQTQVAFWQKVLRLQDWRIDIEFWPHHALDSSIAKTIWNANNKSATIALRLPYQIAAVEHEWPEGEAGNYDLSIIHELLHLMFQPMECKIQIAEEQSCSLIASALVELYQAQPQSSQLSGCDGVSDKDTSSGHYL